MRNLNTRDIKRVSGGMLLQKNGDILTIGLSGNDIFYYEGWSLVADCPAELIGLSFAPCDTKGLTILTNFSGLPNPLSWSACDAVYQLNINDRGDHNIWNF